jgi:hypothetical protein
MLVDLNGLGNKAFFSATILGKAYKTHEAMLLLCKHGFGEDAFMLSRTLFEIMVMMSYILADNTDDRLMRWVEHDWVTRKEMFDYVVSKDDFLKSLNERIDSGAAEPDVLSTIESECKRVMDKYGYKSHGWSDKSIQKMAKEIGREDAYKTVYKLQCMVGHTNARSINEYMRHSDKEGFVINVGDNLDLVETSLITGLDFFGITLELAGKQLNWNIQSDLNKLGEELSAVMK